MIPAKYSYKWSMSITEKLLEAHPRGGASALRLLGISLKDLAHYLATGDNLFTDLRNLIHWLDNAGRGLDDYYTDVQLIQKLREGWRCKSSERLFTRLDLIAKLREQESREGGDRA